MINYTPFGVLTTKCRQGECVYILANSKLYSNTDE